MDLDTLCNCWLNGEATKRNNETKEHPFKHRSPPVLQVPDPTSVMRCPEPRTTSAEPGVVRRTILGVPVDATSVTDAVRTIENWVDERRGLSALYINAHIVNLIHDDPSLVEAFAQSSLNYADGMSMVWAARMLGHALPERVPLTYAIEDLASNWDERGFSVYFLGGEPGRAEQAAERLVARYPGIRVAGWNDGFFSDEQSAQIVDQINESRADILLVGLGNPRQELWVADNIGRLTVAATMTCGGLFDWVSGLRRPAPRWLGRLGLEWLYRLVQEPRRLGARYLRGNPRFLWWLARAVIAGERAVVAPVVTPVAPDLVIDLRDGVPAEARMAIPPAEARGRASGTRDGFISLAEAPVVYPVES
jgi:N-acetylglucosaminyldiphosphoundecaprenol N-acetyl-beta-D-mannosaminyltransferase